MVDEDAVGAESTPGVVGYEGARGVNLDALVLGERIEGEIGRASCRERV